MDARAQWVASLRPGYGQEVDSSSVDRARPSDEELLGRAGRFDTKAFAELYDRHVSVALALACRMLDRPRAEDAVQDAFLAIWRSAATFDADRGAARPWLLHIVRHRCLDALRKLDSAERRRVAAQFAEERAAAPEPLDAVVLRHEAANAVLAAVARLPETQRQVVELAYFGGWTQTQIAERLGLPLGTVKGRARSALHKLRIELDPSREPAG